MAKWSCSGREKALAWAFGFGAGEVEVEALASSERARWAEESMRRMGAGRWILMLRMDEMRSWCWMGWGGVRCHI